MLSILLLMAGSIFTLTLKSSGDATALIEVSQLAATLEQNLREDLRYVPRGRSLIVIQGNVVNSYWSEDEQAIDTDSNPWTPLPGGPVSRDPDREFIDAVTGLPVRERPRADRIMFFTFRPGRSYRDPDVTARLQQVVYGHAEVGQLNGAKGDWKTAPVQFLPQQMVDPTTGAPPTQAHPVPARQWHLARRATLIVDQALSPSDPQPHYPAPSLDDSAAVLTGNDPDPTYSTLAKSAWLRDGRRDYVVNSASVSGNSTTDFNFEDYVWRMTPSPRDDVGVKPPSGYPNFPSNSPSQPEQNEHWLVPWFARTRLDQSPPSAQAKRLGQYFLPHCASFKVEWTFDWRNTVDPNDTDLKNAFTRLFEANGGLFWVDPADMNGTNDRLSTWIDNIQDLPTDPLPPNDPKTRLRNKLLMNELTWDIGRFGKTFVGTNHAFYAKDPAATTAYAPDPYFPVALRVTVDLFDSAGRLERPIRYVFVVPVGAD